MLLKVDCLPNAVGKQPSIPLIYLGRKWTLNWWWWWRPLMVVNHHEGTRTIQFTASNSLQSLLIPPWHLTPAAFPPYFYRPTHNYSYSYAPDAQTTSICHASPHLPHSVQYTECGRCVRHGICTVFWVYSVYPIKTVQIHTALFIPNDTPHIHTHRHPLCLLQTMQIFNLHRSRFSPICQHTGL